MTNFIITINRLLIKHQSCWSAREVDITLADKNFFVRVQKQPKVSDFCIANWLHKSTLRIVKGKTKVLWRRQTRRSPIFFQVAATKKKRIENVQC